MAKVLKFFKMAQNYRVNGTKTASTARASTLISMVVSMMETGKIIKWMAKASIPGQMA
jgi:hypothetical protein